MSNHQNILCPHCGHQFEFFTNAEESISLVKCPKCKAWIPIFYNEEEEDFTIIPVEELKERLEKVDFISQIKINEKLFRKERKS
ncbi:hypothetical protein J4457_07360 [Candidatus Woesearchaeota archaeon]|nr:hypothetical protein [Candidatus Woesearchaeota archaeon]